MRDEAKIHIREKRSAEKMRDTLYATLPYAIRYPTLYATLRCTLPYATRYPKLRYTLPYDIRYDIRDERKGEETVYIYRYICMYINIYTPGLEYSVFGIEVDLTSLHSFHS